MTDFKSLPKANLHAHFSGCARLNTIAEFAKEKPEDLRAKIDSKIGRSLQEYLTAFEYIAPHLQSADRLERVAFEFIEDCYNDGVIYAESRINPFAYTRGGLDPCDVLNAILKGMREGKRKYGVKNRLILGIVREAGLEWETVELANAFKGSVTAVDVMGNELTTDLAGVNKALALANKNFFFITYHCGENAGPSSIRDALTVNNVTRLGHATRVVENAELMSYINDRRILIEVCLTSNLHTGAVKSIERHPYRILRKKGIWHSLATDNSLIDNITLSSEYELAHKVFGTTLREFRNMTLDSLDAAFIHRAEKEPLKQIVKEYYLKVKESLIYT